MNAIHYLLMPFVFIYRGFISVLLFPYYVVLGIGNLFGIKPKEKKKKDAIAEFKTDEKIKVVKGTRSAYDTPKKAKTPVSPNESPEEVKKRQVAFDKMVKKAREEEKKRIKEQEKMRIEKEKKEKAKQAKELAERKKQEKEDLIKAQKEEELKEKGAPLTFSAKIKKWYNDNIKYDKKTRMELEAKKAVLDETFSDDSGENLRFEKPIIFNYLARNPEGEIEQSSIEAHSRADVYSFLEAEGYEIFEIIPAKAKSNISLFPYKMKTNRLIFYLSQLSAYLKSGIALSDSVKILETQAKGTNEKKTWRAVYYDLSMGDVLSLALDKRGDIFPKLLINMIKTAELTGDLIATLDDMVEYYTESESTKKQMKSAMTYPVVVGVFATIVIAFILIFVVPQFVSIYDTLDSELPGITKIVIVISDFLQKNLLIIMAAVLALILLFIYMFKNIKSFRRTIQEIIMRIPVFGNIVIYNEVTVFTKTFANLINHNVFITDSMDVLSKITDNEVYKKLIYDTANNLTRGEPISKAFKDHWAFPNIAYQMLLTGEKTGRLGPMMERVSNYYQEQHRSMINQMKALIEPIMIVTLAIIVGGIMLSVILPMYTMYDSF